MKKSIKYLIWVVVVIAIVVIGYFSFGRGNASQSKTVTIGVITGTKKIKQFGIRYLKPPRISITSTSN